MHSTKSFATSSAVAASSALIECEHAAVCGNRIARQRLQVRLAQRVLLRRAARIVVLDDRDRRPPKLADERPCGIEVHEIVVGKLLALKLLCARQARRRMPRRNVERRGLVRIFAVAHGLAAFERHVDSLRQFFEWAERDACTIVCGEALQLRGDFAVVARRARVGFAREAEARRQAQLSLSAQLRGDRRIIRRIGDHAHALEILRRRAHHRRPADINVLDQFFRGNAGLRRRRGKWIEIHDHQVDRDDRMFGGLLAVLGLAALEKNSAVHFRMQRLHAPAQHFRPSGQFGHVAHGNARVAQQLRGAASRNNFNSQRRKFPREFRDAGFVVDADERPFDRHSRASRISSKERSGPV